jgi:hypothetical protein
VNNGNDASVGGFSLSEADFAEAETLVIRNKIE